MAEFPFACNIQGDYGYKVIVVDDDDTIETVISKAAGSIVGVLVPQFPSGTILKARVKGAKAPLPATITVKEAGLPKMEALEIYSGD